MQTVKTTYSVTTEVKRSKFLTCIVPISEIEGLQKKLKKEHPKANHVVYALRYVNEFNQIVENSSDDGEPKGCAGTPSLNVMRGQGLVDCAVFIVRYFGGIKLGTGGMARAYALSVKNVLEITEILPYEKEIVYDFTTKYNEVDRTLYHLRCLGLTKYVREFGTNNVEWSLRASEEKIAHFKETQNR